MAARARYRTEQRREQGPVRPVQLRAARLPLLQDCELVAQDQDFGGQSAAMSIINFAVVVVIVATFTRLNRRTRQEAR